MCAEHKREQIFTTQKMSKSTGLDDIPARFLRNAAEVKASILTCIVKLSIENGIVPS